MTTSDRTLLAAYSLLIETWLDARVAHLAQIEQASSNVDDDEGT